MECEECLAARYKWPAYWIADCKLYKMKSVLLSIVFMANFYFNGIAQQPVMQAKVPATLLKQFNSDYKNPANVKWWMKDSLFRVEFGAEGKKQLVEFDASGIVMATGVQVLQADLPPSIGHDVKERYENRRIKETYKVERTGNIIYSVRLKGEPRTILFYSEDGKLSNVDGANW